MLTFLIFLSALLFSGLPLSAQFNISCNYRETCNYNETTKKFDVCDKYEDNSLFRINADMTMFVHTTETIKSAYYVDSQNIDKETGVIELKVTSDVGNAYIYLIDVANEEIRVIAKSDDKLFLVRFYIKKAWKNP